MHRIFPSQQENESVYLVVREHWVRLLLKFLIWAIFAAALAVILRFGPEAFPQLFEGSSGMAVNLLVSLGYLFLLLSGFIVWVMYYLNIQVVTNLRIVDIDQVGLFHHTVAELHIENIEDVSSEVSGVLGTMFNYGDVKVQTAGATERFVFENVPNPASIEKMVLDLYDAIPGPRRRKD